MTKVRSSATRQKIVFAALCAFTSSAFLAICSRSSFLYPMNNWVDENCFHTVGRAVLRGKVLYRDIYEQKGPLLYFIYALLAAISSRSFLPVYFMETACVAAFLCFSGKCAGLYVRSRPLIVCMMPVLAAACTACRAFSMGGSVEETCLFMIPASLYFTLRTVEEEKPVPARDAFFIGLFAAAAFWIKYTMCGFYFGLVLFVIVYTWAGLRDFRRLLKSAGWFLLGFAILTVPILLYFVVNGALGDLFQVYFYDNIFLYSKTDGGRVSSILHTMGVNLLDTLTKNRLYMGMAILGLVWFLVRAKARPWQALAAALSAAGLVVLVYVGGAYHPYYGLYLAGFSVFGLIAAAQALQWLAGKLPHPEPPRLLCAGLAAALGAGMLYFAYDTSPNVYMMAYEKEDMPQYQFAKTIQQVPGATLLNYGFLDGGFFFASGAEPPGRFFCTLNIELPEMREQMRQYLEEGLPDFVVVRGTDVQYMLEYPFYYQAARTERTPASDDFTYFLFYRYLP